MDDREEGHAGGLVYRDSYAREARPPGYREPDVIYVPTPPTVVDAMLALAQVGGEDRLYDLGSGDGRIPIAAARRFGTRGVGIDIDPVRIREAEANARATVARPIPKSRATWRCGTPSATSRRIRAQSSTEITHPICLGGLVFDRRYGLVFKRRRQSYERLECGAGL